jgi:FtsH-binding integral membrane protein
MTESNPPELPEESNASPSPTEDGGRLAPPDAAERQSGRYYDSRTLWLTAGIVVLIVAVGTWLLPYIGLVVPLVLLVSVFFLAAKNQTVRYRSVLAGLLIGLGVGLLVTAGVCTAIFSGNLTSPLLP